MSEVTLIHGDALEELAKLPADSVDAIVADPPYGIAVVGGDGLIGVEGACRPRTYAPVYGDDRPFDPAPILVLGKPCVLWGANYFAETLPRGTWLVWDKQRPAGGDFAECELAWCSRGRSVRILHHLWHGMLRKGKEVRFHPTQKPVAVMRWAIEQLHLPDGATICDPYMGSGSTGVAARQMGYSFIGIEIDEHWFNVAKDRIESTPEPLFT